MQLSDSPNSSSANSNSEQKQFTVTVIDERSLLVRLTKELRGVMPEIRRAVRDFRDDPVTFVRYLMLSTLKEIRRQLTPTNVIGFTSACLVIGSLAFSIFTFERGRGQTREPEAKDASTERPVLLVLTATSTGQTSLYAASTGRVGLSRGRGEGSAPQPAHAGGGGSGGMGDLLPTQIGKVPQWSEIPAPIPKDPPLKAPTLPAAGVDIDPLLWTDIKYPVYGNPQSRSNIQSNGPGEDGGMGTKNGFGVGDGSGNGYGDGNNGNTGGGDRSIGYGGSAGGVGGYNRLSPGSEVDQKVRLLAKPEPQYTDDARRNQITGTVVLRVVFSSTGEITQIQAVHTLPFGLTERAIAAARAIKFIPAMKGGRPVSVYMQLEYNFNLY